MYFVSIVGSMSCWDVFTYIMYISAFLPAVDLPYVQLVYLEWPIIYLKFKFILTVVTQK